MKTTINNKHNNIEKSDEQKQINGFQLIENYLTKEQEALLFNNINQQKWVVDYQRRLQYYNYRNEHVYPYNLIPIPDKIPDFLNELIDRIVNDHIVENKFDQIIVNEYKPGEGLKPHFDRKDYFQNIIVGVSLNSATTMEFYNEKTSPDGCQKKSILIPRRSLYVLKDDARYVWKHGISSKKYDIVNGIRTERKVRVSITFRNVVESKIKQENIIYPESKILGPKHTQIAHAFTKICK